MKYIPVQDFRSAVYLWLYSVWNSSDVSGQHISPLFKGIVIQENFILRNFHSSWTAVPLKRGLIC